MDKEIAVQIARLARRRSDEFWTEVISMLSEPDRPITAHAADATKAADAGAREGDDGTWDPAALDLPAPVGGWTEIGREEDATYRWADGNVDEYAEYIVYEGTGGFSAATLALGFLPNGDVVGFHLGEGRGSKRGITYFFPADDFDKTDEKVSMIRGGGQRGRSGFAPADPLPGAYGDVAADVLRERVPGKWNVQAVVARANDYATMLLHTFLQAKLRRLV